MSASTHLSERPTATLGRHHLDVPVRDLMTPGVISIVEDAPLRDVFAALLAHRVHGLLVVGRTNGTPLGWNVARGLLPYLDHDDSLMAARDVIVEPAVSIEPLATAREALELMAREHVTRLLVTPRHDIAPEGVITDYDLIKVARR